MSSSPSKIVIALAAFACVALLVIQRCDAKLLRRTRYYDELDGGYGGYGGYGGGGGGYGSGGFGGAAMPTGERAMLTIRGARNPYDGSAPSKIAIEDNPYRGPYPRGIYDRLDGGRPIYPFGGYGNEMGSFGGGYGRQQMYGAPSRIAVTGAYPYGYGARF